MSVPTKVSGSGFDAASRNLEQLVQMSRQALEDLRIAEGLRGRAGMPAIFDNVLGATFAADTATAVSSAFDLIRTQAVVLDANRAFLWASVGRGGDATKP